MIWGEILRSALRSLGANRLRTALTMLGMIIGVAAVVAMISIGEGARVSIERSIQSLGTNLLTVRPGAAQRGGVRSGNVETLVIEDADALRLLPGVVRVAPEVYRSAQVRYLAANANAGVVGSAPEYLQVRALAMAQGSFLTDADVKGRRRVAVLGAKTARDLFGGLDPVGERIQIRGQTFAVIGVFVEKGEGWQNYDEQIVIPVTTHQRVLFGIAHLSTISVQAVDGYDIPTLQADIERTLRGRHRIRPGEADDFNVRTQKELLQSMGEMTGTLTRLLGGVAAVSLLVGGIGIMNIMLVSVRERTREIGIRKAVGARRSDILLQFLIEAVIVSVAGGLVGIALGYGISSVVGKFGEWEMIVPLYAVVLAVGTSAAIGIGFGVWPAREAARLDPVEALRYE